jgi:replication factor A1
MELIEGDAAPAPAPAEEEKPVVAEEEKPKAEDVTMTEAAPVPAAETAAAKTPAAVKTAGTTTKTPASGPTPPSGGRLASRKVQPISSLNPYMNGWAIRAKLVSKTPKRSFNNKSTGQPSAVFSAELLDEAGTTIEGTFWKEAADRHYDTLEEGKVYIFARGSVKPANKAYNRTRNPYCLHFDASTEVEASEGDIKADIRMEFVPIEQLVAFIDKKAPIDLIGIVTSVQPLGSVKRKSDSTELSRRDVTLVDTARKTVTVTLWGSTAEGVGAELEAAAAGSHKPVVAISACRVSSYNGVSVSTLGRSQILIDPTTETVPEAQVIRTWWDTEGNSAEMQAVGEGMATALKPGGGSAASQRRDLASIRKEAPATPDAKPVYATVQVAVANINPDQSMWYLACPENNRKVIEQDGGFFCEYDGRTYATATKRYIMSAKFTDISGEMNVQVFDDQAKVLLGQSADDASELRDKDPSKFSALLQDATWSEWVLRVKAQAQEYNGEVRQRYAVVEIKPVDFVAETRRALELIAPAATA